MLEEICQGYTLMFIFGYDDANWKELCSKREKYLEIKFEDNEKDKEVIMDHANSIGLKLKEGEGINVTNFIKKKFDQNRGTYEKEYAAIRNELNFWFREKSK